MRGIINIPMFRHPVISANVSPIYPNSSCRAFNGYEVASFSKRVWLRAVAQCAGKLAQRLLPLLGAARSDRAEVKHDAKADRYHENGEQERSHIPD